VHLIRDKWTASTAAFMDLTVNNEIPDLIQVPILGGFFRMIVVGGFFAIYLTIVLVLLGLVYDRFIR
jgi:hypothetical protein